MGRRETCPQSLSTEPLHSKHQTLTHTLVPTLGARPPDAQIPGLGLDLTLGILLPTI